MSVISPKTSLRPWRQSRGKVPAVCGGKDLWKRLILSLMSEREGVMDGSNDDDVGELPWVKCGECEGDWIVDWRNETRADSRDVVMQNEMSDFLFLKRKMVMVEKWWHQMRNECARGLNRWWLSGIVVVRTLCVCVCVCERDCVMFSLCKDSRIGTMWENVHSGTGKRVLD